MHRACISSKPKKKTKNIAFFLFSSVMSGCSAMHRAALQNAYKNARKTHVKMHAKRVQKCMQNACKNACKTHAKMHAKRVQKCLQNAWKNACKTLFFSFFLFLCPFYSFLLFLFRTSLILFEGHTWRADNRGLESLPRETVQPLCISEKCRSEPCNVQRSAL